MCCARIHYVGHLVAGILVLLGVRVLAPRVPSIRALCWIRTATERFQVDTRGRKACKHTCWNNFPQSAEPEKSPINTNSRCVENRQKTDPHCRKSVPSHGVMV